jgi:hypothetical protein
MRRVIVMSLKSLDEREDRDELRDPKVKAAIASSNADFIAGRVRPATELLAELKQCADTMVPDHVE